jgi:hypothetical protein
MLAQRATPIVLPPTVPEQCVPCPLPSVLLVMLPYAFQMLETLRPLFLNSGWVVSMPVSST